MIVKGGGKSWKSEKLIVLTVMKIVKYKSSGEKIQKIPKKTR